MIAVKHEMKEIFKKAYADDVKEFEEDEKNVTHADIVTITTESYDISPFNPNFGVYIFPFLHKSID